MQYIGGKANLVRCFWQVLDAAIRRSSGRFYEPFVGGFNVVSELLKQRVPIKGRPQCSDKHAGLIGMYQALVDGSFVPPASISKEKYLALREQKASDPLSVFASFACAFSGREWASYARGINRNYADCGRRLLAKKRFAMSQCQFFARDFRDSTPEAGSVIYCDPPYINTSGYSAGKGFSHHEFYAWCLRIGETCDVYVSEWLLPTEVFDLVWTKDRRLRNVNTTEKKPIVRELIGRVRGRYARENPIQFPKQQTLFAEIVNV